MTAFGLEFEHNQWLKGGQVSPSPRGRWGPERRWWGHWAWRKKTNPWVSHTHSTPWITSTTKASLPHPCHGSLPYFLPRKDTQWKGQVIWLILDPTTFQNLDLTFVKHDPTNASSLFPFIFEPCRKQTTATICSQMLAETNLNFWSLGFQEKSNQGDYMMPCQECT